MPRFVFHVQTQPTKLTFEGAGSQAAVSGFLNNACIYDSFHNTEETSLERDRRLGWGSRFEMGTQAFINK